MRAAHHDLVTVSVVIDRVDMHPVGLAFAGADSLRAPSGEPFGESSAADFSGSLVAIDGFLGGAGLGRSSGAAELAADITQRAKPATPILRRHHWGDRVFAPGKS